MEVITYNVLICDDNIHYINRLREEFSKVNSKNDNFYLNIDISNTPSKCLYYIREKVYDIIILDVCIRSENQNEKSINDLIRFEFGIEYYGPELYNQILKDNPTAKVFVLSNLSISKLRAIFNYADVEYFNKSDSSVVQIAQFIKNYFDTGKERIFNNIFVVYGHNYSMKSSVENYIKSLGLNSIDLFNQSSGGIQSIFDALSECANFAECSIVLLSADDIVLDTDNLQMLYRARQNVIFEMGLFAGHLGRNKVIVMYENHAKFEFPSDISGIFYIEYDKSENWKDKLKSNLKRIGFAV